jgi:diguanylate cyclase
VPLKNTAADVEGQEVAAEPSTSPALVRGAARVRLPDLIRDGHHVGLRAGAVAVLWVYLVAMFVGPRHFVFWRDWGLQCAALGMQTLYLVLMVRGEKQYRRWRVPLTVMVGCLFVGNLIYNWHLGPITPPIQNTVGSAIMLIAEPFAMVAVLSIHRYRGVRPHLGTLLDVAVVTAAIWSSFLAIAPVVAAEAARRSGLSLWLILAMPAFDVLQYTLTVAAITLSSARPQRMSGWMLTAYLVFPLGDLTFSVQQATGSWQGGTLVDIVWVVGCALVSLGAGAGAPVQRVRAAMDAWTVVVPLASALLALSLLVVATRVSVPVLPLTLATIAVVLSLIRLAVAYRTTFLLAETHRLAHTDDLTGLDNRRAFRATLQALLDGVDRVPVVLALVDLNHFKEVNDTLGHDVGDELLVAVARRMAGVVEPLGVLARLGGDEFAAIARAGDTQADALAEAMLESLRQPVQLKNGRRLQAEASIGVAVGTAGTMSVGELLRRADVAMYQAKRSGGGHRVFEGSYLVRHVPTPSPAPADDAAVVEG